MSRRTVRVGVLLTLTLLVAAVGAGPAGAAPASGPAWSLTGVALPTKFTPGTTSGALTEAGPAYEIVAVSVGSEPLTGNFAVEDTLPVGIEIAAGSGGPIGRAGKPLSSEPLSCEVTGRRVRCTGSAPVAKPGEGGGLRTGEEVAVTIPVQVDSNASGVAIDEMRVEGGGAQALSTAIETEIEPGASRFGFLPGLPGLSTTATGADGSPVTAAGAHPYQLTVGLAFTNNRVLMRPGEPNKSELLSSGGGVRDIHTVLPPGTVVNPQAAATCTEAQLETAGGGGVGCPGASQVGLIRLNIGLGRFGSSSGLPLYNMVTPFGSPAVLAFEVVEGVFVHLVGSVRSDGQYELAADADNILAKVPVFGVEATFWGDPSDASHDAARGSCFQSIVRTECAVPRTDTALLTLPTDCSSPTTIAASIDSWEEPGAFLEGRAPSTDREGNPVGIDGCNQIQFSPTIHSQATTVVADSPTGLNFELHQPQDESYGSRSPAALKDTAVTLPEGMTLNPSAAAGLAGCTAEQIGLQAGVGGTPIRFDEAPQACPDAAKVGSVEVKTPLLGHPLPGAVYVAKPFENPFDSLLAIYLAVEDPQTGIVAKLAGRVSPDPNTGQLTATFEESPQLPLEDIDLHFFEGARAALKTSLTCGTETTTSTMTPWSTPEGADAHPSDSFATLISPLGGTCPTSEGAAPKAVALTAGTVSPLSGAFSPFVLRMARPDGSQHITGIETTLPEGLLGRLAGITYCPEAGIAQARSREAPEKGREETVSPSCPQSSELGTVDVTAGAGITPFPVSGHAYLAGPYKGAPLSLVAIVPAVAGPFDLGTVVDRVALNVDEYSARIHAVADPLPTVRDGIPLDVRSIELKLDRPSFTLNPTSCEAMAIEGSISTQAGQSEALKNNFQVGECSRLAFRPKIAISLKGQTRRTGHPALTVTVTYPHGGDDANIARAQVSLPHSEFLDQGNIGRACTKPVLAAHACPASSVYGTVKAWTPLLEKPLEGPVYLVGGYGYKLPALVAELDGQIRVLLVGKVDTGKNRGIRNTFEAVPDAPVEKFVLSMKGGKKYGLLENSEDICRKVQKAQVSFTAQNGRTLNLSPKVANSCKKGGKVKGGGKNGKGKERKGPKSGNRLHA